MYARLHLPFLRRQTSECESDSFGPNTLVLSTQWIDYCTSAHVKGKKDEIHLKKCAAKRSACE